MVKKTEKDGGSHGNAKKLEVKVAHSSQDWRRAKEALGSEHGLGAGREAGDRLCKLVMKLRRFLVLEEARRPNAASQCLGAGLRELVGQWESEHGYVPLLAENFSDPESHAGTVYKATNWTQGGTTKVFSQDHTDFYVPNGRPKKLWLKELSPPAYGVDERARVARGVLGGPGWGAGERAARSKTRDSKVCATPCAERPICGIPRVVATRCRRC